MACLKVDSVINKNKNETEYRVKIQYFIQASVRVAFIFLHMTLTKLPDWLAEVGGGHRPVAVINVV
jgi:hypothetical protein